MSTRDYKRNDVTRVLDKLFVCVAIAGLNQLPCPPLVEGRDAHVRIHVLQPLVNHSRAPTCLSLQHPQVASWSGHSCATLPLFFETTNYTNMYAAPI